MKCRVSLEIKLKRKRIPTTPTATTPMIVHVPMESSSERRSDLVQRQGSPPSNEIRKAKSVGLDRLSAARRIRFAWEIAYRTNFPPISTAGRHFLSARTAGSNYGETDAAVPARP